MGGCGLPPTLGKASWRGTGKDLCWLPLPLHASRRFCNLASSPGQHKSGGGGKKCCEAPWWAQVRDRPAGQAGRPGLTPPHSTSEPFGVTPGFVPLPRCFGQGEDPRVGGTARAVSGESPGVTRAFLGLHHCPRHPAEPTPMQSGLGARVGCLSCPRACVLQEEREAMGGGTQGCAQGSSGVQTPPWSPGTSAVGPLGGKHPLPFPQAH